MVASALDLARADPAKMRKIVDVLMDQVERGIDIQGNAYSLFQTAILLEDKVRQRTRRLESVLHELERSHHELSQAQAQTETAKTRLMDAVESISEGFVHFDADDRLVLCNSKFLECWSGAADIREAVRPGVSFRELSRWTVENGLVEVGDDQEQWLRDRLYRHSNPCDPIIIHLTSGRWLQIRERQTRTGDTVGIYADITDIKRDEERRRERELAEKSILLQSTLDNLPQGVSVFDKQARLVAWNDRFAELLDLPDWLVRPGACFSDYLRYRIERGDCGAETDLIIAARIERTQRSQPIKSEQMLANGTFLEVRCDPMPGGGFVITYTDVTDLKLATSQLKEAKQSLERRVAERTTELTALNAKLRCEIFERAQVEDALRVAKAEAEAANLSKTRFFAGANHDLLQPLNAARLFVSALAERPLGDKERAFAGQIDQALRNVEVLLRTLLDIAKLDAGAVSARLTDFPIGELLGRLIDEFSPVAAEAGLDLVFVPSARFVRSDPALLTRVVRNFLANAIRYTPAGRVLLGCRRQGTALRIAVCDTGVGIADHVLGEVFEEFRQLGPPGEARGKGVGLGLAIVKRLARVLDHPIGVRSQPGKGSMFFIDVPLGSRACVAVAEPVRSAPAGDLAGTLVVVIEDHEAVRCGMGELLAGWGCTVITAADGRAALIELARAARPPGVVIADYHLDRGATGLAAVADIHHACGPVPALIVTADRRREVLDDVRRQGVRVLHKPIKPAKLRALVSHLLSPGQAPGIPAP